MTSRCALFPTMLFASLSMFPVAAIAAQPPAAAPRQADTAPAAADERTADETRQRLRDILQ